MAKVLVDTNVLSDVLYADPLWEAWSSAQLVQHAPHLAVNPLVYAELSYKSASQADTDHILTQLGLEYLELPRPALYLAAKAFQQYRQRGGTRTAPLADFFIGAHAAVSAMPILTRDATRYATYFPRVKLIVP